MLVGSAALLVRNMDGLLDDMGSDLQLTAYLDDGVSEDEQQLLAERVATAPGVERVDIVTKKDALERFERIAGGPELLAGLEKNPLPASLEIHLLPEARTVEATRVLATDAFGWSVAIDEDLMAIAAPGAHDGKGRRGAVHIFERVAGDWLPRAVVRSERPGSERFGSSVALSGRTLATSAWGEDPDDEAWGSIHIFELTRGAWRRVAKFLEPEKSLVGQAFEQPPQPDVRQLQRRPALDEGGVDFYRTG